MAKQSTDLSRVATVGLDIAKHVFWVHAVDAAEQTVVARSLRRCDVVAFFASLPTCLVGIEACGSSHHWGRELQALGHDVRLMPARYVKAYLKREKNDAADAAAICEAVSRPSMQFVKVRTVSNQAALMQHKVREKLVGQRAQLLNALHGHLTEIGIIAAKGRALAAMVRDGAVDMPDAVRAALEPLVAHLDHLDASIHDADTAIARLARADDVARRLMTIPGIGPLTAMALRSTVNDVASFSNARMFSAFLGLVPRQYSSGGKTKLGRISKMGNRYIRKLLVIGAHSVLHHHVRHRDPLACWAQKLSGTKPFKLASVAVANKLARIAFAIMNSDQCYRRVSA